MLPCRCIGSVFDILLGFSVSGAWSSITPLLVEVCTASSCLATRSGAPRNSSRVLSEVDNAVLFLAHESTVPLLVDVVNRSQGTAVDPDHEAEREPDEQADDDRVADEHPLLPGHRRPPQTPATGATRATSTVSAATMSPSAAYFTHVGSRNTPTSTIPASAVAT